MREFFGYFKHEQGRFLTYRYLIIACLFVLLTLYVVHNGIGYYSNLLNSVTETNKIESSRVNFYSSYAVYGTHGLRLAYCPPTQNIFFYASSLSPDLYSHLDASTKANIYTTVNGRNLFEVKPGFKADFSNLMLIVGSFILLFCGYDTFRNREYLKTLSCFTGRTRLYLYVSLARFLWIVLYFAILFTLSVLLAIIEGIHFTAGNYLSMLYFFGIWTFIALVLFLLGTIIGTIKSSTSGISIIIASWLLLVFVFPEIVENVMIKKAQQIPSNAYMELKKWNYFKDFLNRHNRENGPYKKETEKSAASLRLIESFMTNEYKKMEEVDRELGTLMIAKAREYHTLSILTPSTYYRSITDELSGKGYNSVNRFFLYTQDIKEKFTQFYKQKRYYSKDKKVESFIKNDENIYYGKSGFPETTGLGLIVLTGYALLLGLFSYSRFKKSLYEISADSEDSEDDEPHAEPERVEKAVEIPGIWERFYKPFSLTPGRYYMLSNLSNSFKDYLFNVFSGIKSKTMQQYLAEENKIVMDGKDISEPSLSSDFLYICHPDEVPGEVKAGDIFNLAAAALNTPEEEKKRLFQVFGIEKIKNIPYGKLKKARQVDILLAISYMKSFPLYLFVDITRKMPKDVILKIQNRFEEISGHGGIAILLADELNFSECDENSKFKYYDSTDEWDGKVRLLLDRNKN